ncbi:YceI family protein [Flavobacterium difficile]|uniref:YceI family protein n=1 Tax=Flavobacterium difficile TaxID=2709659 RepID=A0ABX0I775_9FLAO|nr:YceI family protein [Flavobacterium difficile]NHM03033.1 YceI family protein [Flavobacterium difficile]
MTTTTWNLNPNQSDFMVRAKKSIIAYMDSSFHQLTSSIDIVNNQLTHANLEFVLDVNKKEGKMEHIEKQLKSNGFMNLNQFPLVVFKSISYEKINENINFVKGYLTINNITKVVELDAKITNSEFTNTSSKVLVEIFGEINRQDFGLISNCDEENNGILAGYNLNVTANLEFTSNSIN